MKEGMRGVGCACPAENGSRGRRGGKEEEEEEQGGSDSVMEEEEQAGGEGGRLERGGETQTRDPAFATRRSAPVCSSSTSLSADCSLPSSASCSDILPFPSVSVSITGATTEIIFVKQIAKLPSPTSRRFPLTRAQSRCQRLWKSPGAGAGERETKRERERDRE